MFVCEWICLLPINLSLLLCTSVCDIFSEWKKHSEETQTLCAGCGKAEPKKIHPAAHPLPGGMGRQNLISWRWSLPLPTKQVWWGSMHALLCYHGNRPTQPHTQTYRQDRLQYTVSQLANAQCNQHDSGSALVHNFFAYVCSCVYHKNHGHGLCTPFL